MSRTIFGLSAALATPFNADGSIDTAKAARHAAWGLANGCASVTLFGTTGEGASVSAAERTVVLDAFQAAGIEAGRIVACVMANASGDARDQAADILRRGGRGVLLAPPSYFKNPTEDGVFAWFSDVLSGLGAEARGIILYNIPSVTAVELSVALVGRLREAFPGAIAGVKDSSGNWTYTQALLAAHKDLAILIGDERSLAAGIRMGAEGAISGMANIMPQRLSALIASGTDDGDLVSLVETVVSQPVIPAVKALIAARTGEAEWLRVRPPLVAISDEAAGSLASALSRLQPAAAAAA